MFSYSRISARLNQLQFKLLKDFKTLNHYNFVRRNTTHQNQTSNRRVPKYATVLGVSSAVAVSYYLYPKTPPPPHKVKRDDLPTYSIHQVRQHQWFTYGLGVYDLASYAKEHPGGEEAIAEVVGGAIEPHWKKYSFHLDPEILADLENLRIGNWDHTRHHHYRNHHRHRKHHKPPRCKQTNDMPQVDPIKYSLEVVAVETGETLRSLKLEDIKKYPKHAIESAIPCKSDPGKGGKMWVGAQLRDILKDLGIKENDYDVIKFECIDTNGSGDPYAASVSINQALDTKFDVLLAYEMEGANITQEHGYPIRVVMPLSPGGRNVKWLSKIVMVKKKNNKTEAA